MNIPKTAGDAKRSYGCLMAVAPEDLGGRIQAWAKRNIADKDLVKEEGKGIEEDTHTTVLYGLHTKDADKVLKLCTGTAIIAKVKGMTLFENDDADVLKLDIGGQDLSKLNEKICDKLKYTNSYDEYHPHMTIAYLKPGTGKKYIKGLEGKGFDGETFTMQMLDYSDADSKHTYKRLPLKTYGDVLLDKAADVTLDLDIGDVVLTGRYKNKRHVVDEIGTDDLGQPTVNGMKLLAMRLEKKMPKSRQSSKTQAMDKAAYWSDYMDKGAGKRFYQPENFDVVHKGKGYKIWAGGNDWEAGPSGMAVVTDHRRVWVNIKHESPANGKEYSKEEDEVFREHGHKAWETWKKLAQDIARAKHDEREAGRDDRPKRAWSGHVSLYQFEEALKKPEMKPFVAETGTQNHIWKDAAEKADEAPKGKAWGVRWADGRALVSYRKKSDAQKFYDSGKGHFWFEAVHDGPKLVDVKKKHKVRNKADIFKCSEKECKHPSHKRQKTAAHPALPELKQAKAYSDKHMYAAKLAILRKLVQERREEFEVDSDEKGILGLTHKPTKFQIHMPKDGFPKTAARKQEKWIGVDLDGTLAKYNGWKGDTHIGDPIPKMVLRMKRWFREGKKVKIFTARAHKMRRRAREAIEAWCMKYLGRKLEITNVKDPMMVRLWDDRAMDVKRNDGTQTRFVFKS